MKWEIPKGEKKCLYNVSKGVFRTHSEIYGFLQK